jgi:hypothetical protein
MYLACLQLDTQSYSATGNKGSSTVDESNEKINPILTYLPLNDMLIQFDNKIKETRK